MGLLQTRIVFAPFEYPDKILKCLRCEKSKPVTVDNWKINAKDGYIRRPCRSCQTEARRKWRENNKDKISDIDKKHYLNNTDKRLLKTKRWKNNNRDKLNRINNSYINKRKQTDPLFKLRINSSSLINKSLKLRGYRKEDSKTADLLGCSIEFFRKHLESQFVEGMSWSNYGVGKGNWTIDHICPCSQAANRGELIKLQHYSNLRPSFDNFTKNDNKTEDAEKKCVDLLGRSWHE